jgi:hypothetical protein
MRNVLTALLIAACAALTAGAADDEKYTSKDGRFKVQFPAGAKVKTKTMKAGALEMNFVMVEESDRAFAVMYMDMPEEAKKAPAKGLLEGAEKGAVAQSGGKLESAKDIEFGKNKYPGREVVVDKDGNKTRTFLILADLRLYVVAAGGKKDFATDKEQDGAKFLASFEITK